MKFSLTNQSLGYAALTCGMVALSGILSSCSSGGAGGGLADTGYGPFNSRGDYVEEWADNPAKWNRRALAQNNVPDLGDAEPILMASNDAPPSNLSPMTSVAPSRPSTAAKPKSAGASTIAANRSSNANTVASTKSKSSPTLAKTSTKLTPSTKKQTVSLKSQPARVTVKKGDTLSALASRHGSSVSAIQRANGMRDTKIVVGRSLVIPRSNRS